MPSFAIEMTSDGANIKVGVSAPEGYVTRTTPPRTWVATIDTGASISFVSPAVVAAIEPPHVGRASFRHMNGCSEVDIVLVMIRLGGHDVGGK